MYDRNGNEIDVFQRENIQPFTLAQVPPDVIDAVLAVEDKEFYPHNGVNVRSLIRAMLSNFSSGATRQGASTITQQVVKNEFLAGLPRDGRYKMLQAHYAVDAREEDDQGRDPRALPQHRLLREQRLRPRRPRPRRTSARTSSELTLVEGAFLAGLIRSPSGYDPFRNPERARARFEQVLDRLVDDGHHHRGGTAELLDARGRSRRCRSVRPVGQRADATSPRRCRTTC